MTAAPLERRERDLAALADGQLDVLVVGGGLVGRGARLAATTRGLRATPPNPALHPTPQSRRG